MAHMSTEVEQACWHQENDLRTAGYTAKDRHARERWLRQPKGGLRIANDWDKPG